MTSKSHYYFGLYLLSAELYCAESTKRTAFLCGCVEPDLNPGTYLKGSLYGQKQLDKYDGWTKNKERFDRMFALAIFLPVASDDFRCYLAGTTAMSWRRFVIIVSLGKPLAIAAYSLLLNTIWSKFLLG